MELELVEFETAELAKELGFNEICNNIIIRDIDRIRKLRKISIVGMRNEEKQLPSLIATLPEQALLQMWLRKNYNIHIAILCEKLYNDKLEYSAKIEENTSYRGSLISLCINRHIKDNYEDCLESALIVGLNRIKELKIQSNTN